MRCVIESLSWLLPWFCDCIWGLGGLFTGATRIRPASAGSGAIFFSLEACYDAAHGSRVRL